MDYKIYKQKLMEKLDITDNQALEIVKALELMTLIWKDVVNKLKETQNQIL